MMLTKERMKYTHVASSSLLTHSVGGSVFYYLLREERKKKRKFCWEQGAHVSAALKINK